MPRLLFDDFVVVCSVLRQPRGQRSSYTRGYSHVRYAGCACQFFNRYIPDDSFVGCFLLPDHPRNIQRHFWYPCTSQVKVEYTEWFVYLFCCYFRVETREVESWEQIFAKTCVLQSKFSQNWRKFGLSMPVKMCKWGLDLELNKSLKWWVTGTKKWPKKGSWGRHSHMHQNLETHFI